MNQGMKRLSKGLRHLPLMALVLALPATSMTGDMTVGPAAPTVAQRLLIEAHDTAGVGWWSSSALEIEPAPAVARITGSGKPVLNMPGVRRRIRTPGAESS